MGNGRAAGYDHGYDDDDDDDDGGDGDGDQTRYTMLRLFGCFVPSRILHILASLLDT